MLSKNSLAKEPEKSSLTSRLKFQRRNDLTTRTRLKIASEATFFARYGTVTRLSERYGVSRPFIYEQKSQFLAEGCNIFEVQKVEKPTNDLSTLAQILRLRLIGRCSLSSISELLSIQASECNSVGYISESLQRVGNQLGNQTSWSGQTVAATDELYFAGHQPILVTVDVVSQAILKIELIENFSSLSWHNHLESLQKAGIQFLKIISDEGNVMSGGRRLLSESVTWQPDTFHAVSGRLGVFKSRLSKQLSALHTLCTDRQTLVWATQSEKVRAKAFAQWEKAFAEIPQIEQLQSQFLFLYGCILQQFQLFSGRDATLRNRSFAEKEVECAIEWLKTLPIKGLAEELKAIQNTLPNLFHFLDFAQENLKAFEAQVDPLAAPYWKRAWQAAKIAAKIKNNYPQKQLWNNYCQSDLRLLNDFYSNCDSFEEIKRTLFAQLDRICAQASSPVETANSFIRPFLNQARDQIQQHSLNLLMFYYNHRILKRGKHKGFSPLQILTGDKNAPNWLDLMLKRP